MLSTASKISIARLLSRSVMLGRRAVGLPPVLTATRGGIVWRLDLHEGIDLSIYLLGAFEPATVRLYRRLVQAGDVVLDIGANIGAHTLPLAALVGESGKVCAFEPTRYAFAKLHANLELNPELAARVVSRQAMLVATPEAPMETAIYSSWPLDSDDRLHEKHRGRLMDTGGGKAATLDSEVGTLGLARVDFIKLDVDGHEHDVLAGGQETLRRCRPRILLELAPYVFAGRPQAFEDLLHGLWSADYDLRDVSSGRALPRAVSDVVAAIPRDGGINVLATPR